MTQDYESPLLALPGIQEKRCRRLEAAGIDTMQALIDADDDRLHHVLGMSIQQVRELRANAIDLLESETAPADADVPAFDVGDWVPSIRRDVFVIEVTHEEGEPIRSSVQHVGAHDSERGFRGLPLDRIGEYVFAATGLAVAPPIDAETPVAGPPDDAPDRVGDPTKVTVALSPARYLLVGLTTGGRPQDVHVELDTGGLARQGLGDVEYRVSLLAHEPGQPDEVAIGELAGAGRSGSPIVLDFRNVYPPPGVQALRLAVCVGPWDRADRIPAVGVLTPDARHDHGAARGFPSPG